MRVTILIIVIGLFSGSLTAQNYFDYLFSNKGTYLTTGAAVFVSGGFDGVTQVLDYHYGDFKRVFPRANDSFWNNDISWTRKYKDYPTDKRARYFGAKTFLVWTTDGYHLMRAGRKASFITAVVTNFSNEKKLHWYLYDIVLFNIISSIGFHLMYTVIF